MSVENQELIHSYFDELRALRDGPEFAAEPDIDMVWVFSGHGTYEEEGNQPPYAGTSFDRLNVEAGIEAVYAITANRLDKPVEEVTKDDIAEHGPVLFYNGESEETEGVHYHQNEAMQAAVVDPDFPLPAEKVVIRPIDKGFTPAQMDSFIRFMGELSDAGMAHPQKIAVVSSFGHRPRVGRYLAHQPYASQFPAGVEFVNGPIPKEADAGIETAQGQAIVLGEARRVVRYHNAGHLATVSALAA